MQYCDNCGGELADGAEFYPNCGQNSAYQPIQRQSTSGKKRLHCPGCGSFALNPVVETNIRQRLAVNRFTGSRTGAGEMRLNSTLRNYWMCDRCGRKFRSLRDLKGELAYLLKALKQLWMTLTVLVVLIILAAFVLDAEFALIGGVCLVLPMAIAISVYGVRALKLKSEKAYLEKHCFD